MTLPAFQLTEPIVSAMVTLMSANLNAVIDTLNASLTDTYTVPHAVQFLPYVPIPSTIEGGLPAIGVQRMGSSFEGGDDTGDDLQFTVAAAHHYAVVAVLQNADHLTLTWQLDRMLQAIAYTIQADRLTAATASIMKTQGGAWSVNLVRSEPGPLFGEPDPLNVNGPPKTYMSWIGLVLHSMRWEQT